MGSFPTPGTTKFKVCMSNYKLTSDKSTAVSVTDEWLPLTNAPLGVKIQLLTVGRVGVHGKLDSRNVSHYLAWAPVPKEPQWLKDME